MPAALKKPTVRRTKRRGSPGPASRCSQLRRPRRLCGGV